MKKAMNLDLIDLSDILEGFIKKLDKLSQPELIDLAARLKPVAKHCETIDKHVKEMVKDKLDHVAGELPGTSFIAELKIVPTERLEQKRFKEERPAMYKEYTKTDEDERVSFKVR